MAEEAVFEGRIGKFDAPAVDAQAMVGQVLERHRYFRQSPIVTQVAIGISVKKFDI